MSRLETTATVADPLITVGHFRIFNCTDGKVRLHDDARPFGEQTSKRTFKTTGEAKAFAEQLLVSETTNPKAA